jgi:hypothetical protein
MQDEIQFQADRLDDVRWDRLDLLYISADQGIFTDQIDDAGNSLRVEMDKLRRFG